MSPMPGRNGFQGIQSVARAMSILELFSDKRPSLSISEVAELTGLNRATCYRFCQTFRKLGYLEELPDRRFRPGAEGCQPRPLGARQPRTPRARAPYLERLRADINETVNMGLLDDTEVVYVRPRPERPPDLAAAVRGQPAARLRGFPRPLDPGVHARGAGDGHHRPQRAEAITSHTIIDRKLLLPSWADPRAGYAFNDQEIANGLRGVAAPVLTETGGRSPRSTCRSPTR